MSLSMVISEIKQLDNLNFDVIPIDETWNVGNASELKMHRIHAYPAKFPAFITTKALGYAQANGVQVDTVADIFCGCGTAAFEAKRNNKDFWGCDVNPVATLIAKVKSRKYHNPAIYKYYDQIIITAKAMDIPKREVDEINERIKYWFFEKEIKNLLQVKKAIYHVFKNKNKYQEFFLLAFSNILKPTSRWLTKSIKPQVDPNKVPTNVFEAFDAQVKLMIDANAESDLIDNSKVDINNTSFLKKKIEKPFVDLIVTSPPYVTSYEYADLHQLSTLWLDYANDYRDLRNGSIGSLQGDINHHENKELNSTAKDIVSKLDVAEKRKARSVAKYFFDMQKTSEKCYRILNDGGLALFVIGNTEYKNVKIDNAKHLVESMLDAGFRHVDVCRRKITKKILTPYRDERGKFTTDKNSRKVYAEEFIVVGKKD